MLVIITQCYIPRNFDAGMTFVQYIFQIPKRTHLNVHISKYNYYELTAYNYLS